MEDTILIDCPDFGVHYTILTPGEMRIKNDYFFKKGFIPLCDWKPVINQFMITSFNKDAVNIHLPFEKGEHSEGDRRRFIYKISLNPSLFKEGG